LAGIGSADQLFFTYVVLDVD